MRLIKVILVSMAALSSTAFADDLAQQMEEMVVMGAVKSEAAAQYEIAGQKDAQDEVIAELPVVAE